MFDQILANLARHLDEASVPYMIYGGQAVLIHGEPRFTRYIDVSLGVDNERLKDVLKVLERCSLKPAVPNPARFVAETYILPADHAKSQMRVDFCFSFTPFEQLAISRATPRVVADYPVRFA